ncbi:DUF1361 domain-containing protein [Paenibacillus hexagrammi]|uniref:DUF1361 domain-containing protein n=1 Tax=Paenibacillus hexagrammi TaxID=2908839 RepID=A0ABY3SCS9_9BACL|nr:DUF1361 domain-containing protein [Paenibacillus sp. YPD9-1]UJF31228.1 DUF1361 domain-containing protein [Paenibacillus sp. YPD9-1]
MAKKADFRFGILFGLAFWLLFYPNSPYIITDIVHLTYLKTSIPIQYDILLNALTAFTALLTGLLSLYIVHEMFMEKFRSRTAWLFVGVLQFLCSIGVFLGRFLRWNSWDIVSDPVEIVQDSLDTIESSSSLIFICAMMLVMCCSYLMVYTMLRYRR